jgi:Mn2+/Fe2+ NRAMP family transporter
VIIPGESRGSKAKALAGAKPLHRSAIPKRKWASWIKAILKILDLGLITGAGDDDPSGIATYSSVGAPFGYGMLWTMPFIYPFMAAIQEISARIGRVAGHGIAGNTRHCYPRWLVCLMVSDCQWSHSGANDVFPDADGQ